MKLPTYIKAASNLFSNPAYRPVASAPKSDPFGKPEYQPAPPPPRPSSMPNGSRNYLQEGVNAATKKVMQPMHQQMNDIARFGTYGLDAELEFDAQGKPVATAKPLQHAPGTLEFAKAFDAWKAKQPADNAGTGTNVLDQQYFPDDPTTWLRMHQRNPQLSWALSQVPEFATAVGANPDAGRQALVDAHNAGKLKVPSFMPEMQRVTAAAPDIFAQPTTKTVLDHLKWMARVNADLNSAAPYEPPTMDHELRALQAAGTLHSRDDARKFPTYAQMVFRRAMGQRAAQLIRNRADVPPEVLAAMQNTTQAKDEMQRERDIASRAILPAVTPELRADAIKAMDDWDVSTLGDNIGALDQKADISPDTLLDLEAGEARRVWNELRQHPGYKYMTADPNDYAPEN